jgi:hypothetical protein
MMSAGWTCRPGMAVSNNAGVPGPLPSVQQLTPMRVQLERIEPS